MEIQRLNSFDFIDNSDLGYFDNLHSDLKKTYINQDRVFVTKAKKNGKFYGYKIITQRPNDWKQAELIAKSRSNLLDISEKVIGVLQEEINLDKNCFE